MIPLHHGSVVRPNPIGELDLECFPTVVALSNPIACPNRQFLLHSAKNLKNYPSNNTSKTFLS
jgi:hypothetical protein